MSDGALDGVRALDLSTGVGGGYCGKLLACYGAEVVKVESPDPRRGLRAEGPFLHETPAADTGAAHLYLDTGKQSVALDLDRADGAALLRQLAGRFDIVIEDHGAQAMRRRGLAYADLAAVNPDLVYVSLSPFGDSGPYAGYAATQLTLYALGGYMALTGDPDREPLQGPGAQPAYLGGVYAFVGALAALWAVADGRGGQHVDVSEFEAVAASHQWTISRYNYSGRVQPRIGNRYDSGHPITIYPASDGYVSVGISTDDQADRFFVLIGRPELSDDPRFSTNLARLEHADEFDALIGPWFAARPAAAIAAQCQEMRIPCARAATVADLLDDPHLVARGFWHAIDQPGVGGLRQPGPPFHLPATPGRIAPAPSLGADTPRLLAELGLAADDVTRLREAGTL